MTERTRALVLGGGGPVGRAWLCGLLSGFEAEGVKLRLADLILGTSAGALAGAQLGLGLDLRPTKPPPGQALTPPKPFDGFAKLRKAMAEASQSPTPEILRQQIGRMALDAATVSEAQSLERMSFLADREWPAAVRTTAVNTRTGEGVVWSRASGVPLALGVASSCALPGAWPPVTVDGDRYMDGGVRSMLNADLAAGYSDVIVVSCFALIPSEGGVNPEQDALNAGLEGEIAGLRKLGAHVDLITPSAEFLDLTQHGAKMLDVTLSGEAFQVGARQGVQDTHQIHVVWR